MFITSKPMLCLVNLSEKDFLPKKNKWLPKIKEYVDKNDKGAMIIPFSGAFEQVGWLLLHVLFFHFSLLSRS